MATYSNLGITLITTGDESGTWGTTTNSNFENILDEAIAGAVTYNISSDADFTLTVVDATSSDARHAVIKFTSTTLSATRTCTFAPDTLQKTWVVINATTGGQSLTFKQGSSGATVTVPNGESAIIYSDGAGATNGAITRVLDSFTNTKITTGTLNATTLDLTNLEVTNIKAKDGTAALTIADSTGKVTVSSELAVDNLNLSGNAITSTNSNGNIDLTPNGTGEVNITKVDIDSGAIDGTTIGANSAAAGTFTTLTATTLGGALNANNQAITNVNIDSGAIDGVTLGTNSPVTNAQIDNININGNAITSTDTNGNIDLTPNGTGEVNITKVDIDGGVIDNVTIGGSTAAAGTFTTVSATTGNITSVNATTVDATNVEVTNIKAKDGTAAATIADSTGKITVSTELAVDNLNLSGNAITSTNTNGNIDLTPNGTGEVNITKVDIDSGTIDGTSVGASSASTGAFTTLSATGNVDFNGGTFVFNDSGADKDARFEGDTDTNLLFLDASADTVFVGTTSNTNSSKLVVNGTISETVSSTQYLVASQYDIGTDPNEIPLNQYLGALAYVDSEWVAPQVGSGITGGTGTICKTSFAVEGGVKKMQVLIDLTGLNSGGTAGDIIGVNGTANPCYIAQIPSTFTILGGRMTCLETPAGGDTDIDLYSATEGTGVEDQAITALTETQIINAGTQSAGTVTYFSADPAANTYFYLVGQSTSNATYTAGRFLIEVFGA
jgi:hypothetical protein